jgi:hypothetical protein
MKTPIPSMALNEIRLTFTRNDLGMGISKVFKIFGHFLFLGDETTM